MKRYISILILSLMILGFSFSSYAGVWEQDEKGWRYNVENDSEYSNSKNVIEVKGKGKYYCSGDLWIMFRHYYFDDDGYMRTGWYRENEELNLWVYLQNDGAAAIDPINPNGEEIPSPVKEGIVYYFDEHTSWCLNPDGGEKSPKIEFLCWANHCKKKTKNLWNFKWEMLSADGIEDEIIEINNLIEKFEAFTFDFGQGEEKAKLEYIKITALVEEYKKMIPYLNDYKLILESGKKEGYLEKKEAIEKATKKLFEVYSLLD